MARLYTPVDLATFFPEDVVEITGTSGSNTYYTNLRGMISTLCQDAVKIWPNDDSIEWGKVWFEIENIQEITLIERY